MRVPLAILRIWAALVIPSWAVVGRFTGGLGVTIYSVVVLAALIVFRRFTTIPTRRVPALALLWVLAIVMLFALVYPRINVHEPGIGSDDDDAHDLGVHALLAGDSPYDHRTYLDNALHQLPGAFVLSAPFTLMGTSALQNLVCLPLFFVLMARRTSDRRTAVILAWLALLLSPGIAYQVVTGSSYSWSAIWIVLALFWLASRPGSIGAAVFCGVAICSKPNFLFLLPLIFGWMYRAHGSAKALRAMVLVAATVAALTAPFLFSGSDFGPAEGFSRLSELDTIFPGASIAIVVLMSVAAFGLSIRIDDLGRLFAACAIVQAIPVVAGIVLLMAGGDPAAAFAFAAFGSFASWFALMASADAFGADEAARPVLRA
jgi:hypothetical protein